MKTKNLLDEAIRVAELIENNAINNYHEPFPLKQSEILLEFIDWAYRAKLARGDDKSEVLNRFDRISKELKRAETRRIV